MRMDYPYIQHAKGERWMFDHVEFGRNGFNLLCEEDLIVNELEKDVEYNGWYYCAMVLENKKKTPEKMISGVFEYILAKMRYFSNAYSC